MNATYEVKRVGRVVRVRRVIPGLVVEVSQVYRDYLTAGRKVAALWRNTGARERFYQRRLQAAIRNAKKGQVI